MQIEKDSVVQFSYCVTDLDEQELERSPEKAPIAYLHGHNNMMPGLEKALDGKAVGDKFTVQLEASETYGEIIEGNEQRISVKHLQGDKKTKWKAGMTAVVNTEQGPREVKIVKTGKFMVTVDLNHPFAGRTLNFALEVLDVRPATKEELEHGHAHGVGGHHH